MRFAQRPRCPYLVTDRKRAAASRLQRRQRDALPLLAPLIAETQPSIDFVMTERVAAWTKTEREERDRRARAWRKARRALDADHDPDTRRTLLDYWNAHRWLPGDPSYLLDMLHGYAKGRLVIDDGQVRAARSIISPAEAVAAFGRPKPSASGWFCGRLASPGSAP